MGISVSIRSRSRPTRGDSLAHVCSTGDAGDSYRSAPSSFFQLPPALNSDAAAERRSLSQNISPPPSPLLYAGIATDIAEEEEPSQTAQGDSVSSPPLFAAPAEPYRGDYDISLIDDDELLERESSPVPDCGEFYLLPGYTDGDGGYNVTPAAAPPPPPARATPLPSSAPALLQYREGRGGQKRPLPPMAVSRLHHSSNSIGRRRMPANLFQNMDAAAASRDSRSGSAGAGSRVELVERIRARLGAAQAVSAASERRTGPPLRLAPASVSHDVLRGAAAEQASLRGRAGKDAALADARSNASVARSTDTAGLSTVLDSSATIVIVSADDFDTAVANMTDLAGMVTVPAIALHPDGRGSYTVDGVSAEIIEGDDNGTTAGTPASQPKRQPLSSEDRQGKRALPDVPKLLRLESSTSGLIKPGFFRRTSGIR